MSGSAFHENPHANGPAPLPTTRSREREDWREDVWGDYGYQKPPRAAEAVASSDDEETDK
jgi:hypothetical protein